MKFCIRVIIRNKSGKANVIFLRLYSKLEVAICHEFPQSCFCSSEKQVETFLLLF